MKVPDKIYIAETPNKLIEIWSEEPIESKPYITEHEYIRKDTLLKWAKNKKAWLKQGYKRDWKNDDTLHGGALILDSLIDKIEAL